jgi:hypothetical protein
LFHDERGISYVFVGIGMVAFMAATTLGIDVGMVMTARSQAQNSADMGALAGAVALAFNSATDQTSGGPAVQSAVNTAEANLVIGQAPSVETSDITFPLDPSGQPTRIHVNVFRTAARGNAIPTLVASMFGVNTIDIGAGATAEAVPTTAATCVKPWSFPDKWTERQTPPFDTTDTFNAFPSSPTVSPDQYLNVNNAGFTGYKSTNIGTQITIKPAPGGTIPAAGYYSLDLPGAQTYQTDVETCNGAAVQIGDVLTATPSVPATTQTGVNDLIAEDPSAYYDAVKKGVVTTLGTSPRVVAVPVYDPYAYNAGQQTGTPVLKVADIVGFFIESVNSNGWITGRIVPILGVTTGTSTAPANAFARAIRLVE